MTDREILEQIAAATPGWKLVPEEPSEMAVHNATVATGIRPGVLRAAYRAMLAATPQPEQGQIATPARDTEGDVERRYPRGHFANHDPQEIISYIDAFGSETSQLMCQCRDVIAALYASQDETARLRENHADVVRRKRITARYRDEYKERAEKAERQLAAAPQPEAGTNAAPTELCPCCHGKGWRYLQAGTVIPAAAPQPEAGEEIERLRAENEGLKRSDAIWSLGAHLQGRPEITRDIDLQVRAEAAEAERDALRARVALLEKGCPFDRSDNNLEPSDPCPVCGMTGEFSDDNPDKCISTGALARIRALADHGRASEQ